MPELVFYRRGEEVLRFALERPRTVLGRGDRSDVVIPDPEVSRSQVAVLLDDGQVRVLDLSGNGTVVRGERVSSATLTDGADITLGQWRALYRERTGGAVQAATEIRGTLTEQQPLDAEPSLADAATPIRLLIKGPTQATLHDVKGASITLGTDAGNDVVVEDTFVSSKHLRITRHGSRFVLTDLGSRNGTFIGALRLQEAEVPAHTTVRLGNLDVTLAPSPAQGRAGQSFEGMVGNDFSMRQLAELIDRVAPSTATVAIFGESGTGKELVAHAVHARSTRSERPFIPVNCAAISKELIESELFGHEKGAFTGAQTTRKGAFEEADGGTLFLDEIGELPVDLQAKLLRALESGEIKRVGASRPLTVDARILVATNRDLLADARAGRFREDLYYRLCVIPLHLAPLRSRKGDIAALAEHFLQRFTPRGQTVRLSPGALERLRAHGWAGNIRELRNVVHRALLLRRGPTIEAADLSFDPVAPEATLEGVSELPTGLSLEQMMEKLERQIVENALRRNQNNRERVAKELGVARSTLFKRLKDWGLTRQEEVE